MLLSIITWVIIGGLAGWLASILTGTNARVNGWMNVAVGIIGAFIGGLVLQLLGVQVNGGLSLSSFLTAVLGAVLLLLLVRAMRRDTV